MQSIFPGKLHDEFQHELREFVRERIVERLWARDLSLWPPELIDRDPALAKLAWLELFKGLGAFLDTVRRHLQAADADGLLDHAVLSSESVNLCLRALLGISGIALSRKVIVLDNTSPDVIQQNEEQLELSRTLFFLVNKQRYGLKDHCLFLYFQDKLQAIEGPRSSRHFVSETEANSYLASVSREHAFRELLPDPPAIAATYCSLLHFGAAITAMRIATSEEILAAVGQMRGACMGTNPPASNPALQVAAFLSSAVADHRAYLTFLASPSLIAYTQGLGQLVGGSMAREAPGLIPLVGVEPRDTSAIEGESAFVLLSYIGDDDTKITETISRFQSSDIPFIHATISRPFDLLPETFKWEVATILACARLGVDPFDVSDNRLPRAFATEILEQISQGQNALQRSPRITDRLIQLYADGMTRQEISTMNLAEALQSFLRVSTPARHVTLLVDLTRTDEVDFTFNVIRRKLTETLQRPVLMVFGPHAAEHTGYFFRDSLPYGPCIVFTTDSLVDKAIPGASYTFAQFHQALALSEYDTLVHWEGPVIRLHLTHEFPAALQQLIHVFEQALHRFQS